MMEDVVEEQAVQAVETWAVVPANMVSIIHFPAAQPTQLYRAPCATLYVP